MTTPRKRSPAKKPSPRRGRPSKDDPIDWLAIEQLYVQGEDKPQPDGSVQHVFPSYADLAARFGLASSSVDRRSRAEGWPAKRDAFQATVRQETQRKAVERLSTRLATFNEEAFETALLGVRESRYALERVRSRRSPAAGGDAARPPSTTAPHDSPPGGPAVESPDDPMPSMDVRNYMTALKTAREVAWSALGVNPTPGGATAPASPETGPSPAAKPSAVQEFSDEVLLAAAQVMLDQNQAPKAHGQGEATPPAS